MLAAAYWLVLTAAILTQPYSACVAIAHLLWSAAQREFRTALIGGAAFLFTILTFLPWYLWSKAAWDAGIAREGFHFSAQAKAPLMVFREVAGAGYWGSALLLALCVIAVPASRVQRLLLMLIAVPVASAFGADAAAGYFVAARQFIWILPAIAILAATAIERRKRAALVLCALLSIVCIRQSVQFFTASRENWQAAATAISNRVEKGACLAVAPPDSARLYEFFDSGLGRAQCQGTRMVLAITPATTGKQRQEAVAKLIAQGYTQQDEVVAGMSTILDFQLVR